uniref:Uncharacterized protein n=1 Tax=Caenorhabditis japonica TaxID=281687 RepID=A0A8R1HPE6_CAEJA
MLQLYPAPLSSTFLPRLAAIPSYVGSLLTGAPSTVAPSGLAQNIRKEAYEANAKIEEIRYVVQDLKIVELKTPRPIPSITAPASVTPTVPSA